MIKSGTDVMKEHGMDPKAPSWADFEFKDAGLSMVVFCNTCHGCIAFPDAVFDGQERPFCEHCVTADSEMAHEEAG